MKGQLHRVISVYGRKSLSVTLIFNALLTIACVVGLLWGLYTDDWVLYKPYLLDGNLLWILVAVAVLNIFPSANFGKVHTGRLWFHHYVYGFFVLFSSAAWLILFTSVSFVMIFFIQTTNVDINAGRFFMLSGLALVLDDLPDVSRHTLHGVRWLKLRAYQIRKGLHAVQFALACFSMYILSAIILAICNNTNWITPSNLILIGTVSVTCITSFAGIAGKVWLNLNPHQDKHHH